MEVVMKITVYRSVFPCNLMFSLTVHHELTVY